MQSIGKGRVLYYKVQMKHYQLWYVKEEEEEEEEEEGKEEEEE
jgi:starvation-inducible outer membrane lipoprotein